MQEVCQLLAMTVTGYWFSTYKDCDWLL